MQYMSLDKSEAALKPLPPVAPFTNMDQLQSKRVKIVEKWEPVHLMPLWALLTMISSVPGRFGTSHWH